jgi:hypothetical protein
MIPGAVLLVLSVFLMSITSGYVQYMYLHGILGGIGSGMLFSPAISVLAHYFSRKLPLVIGVVFAGGSAGAAVLSIMLDRLLNFSEVSFGWSMRILGFIMMTILIFACVLVKEGRPPCGASSRSLIPYARNRRPSGGKLYDQYWFTVLALTFLFVGLRLPFATFITFAADFGISTEMSYFLTLYIAAGSYFGQLTTGALANKLGVYTILAGEALACSILHFCWLKVKPDFGLYVFVVVFGFILGSVLSLMCTVTAQMAPTPSHVGRYVGMAMAVTSIPACIGASTTSSKNLKFAEISAGVLGLVISFTCLAYSAVITKLPEPETQARENEG